MDRLFSLGWRLWQYFFIKDIYFFCENPKTKIHDGSGIHLKDSLNVIWQRSICCLQPPLLTSSSWLLDTCKHNGDLRNVVNYPDLSIHCAIQK